MSSGRVLMDTRLTIIFVDGQLYEIEKINVPQNIDAILVTADNHVISWQPGVDYSQVSIIFNPLRPSGTYMRH